jgi:peptidoglycan/LPS O-acetylase OafA/YrhL
MQGQSIVDGRIPSLDGWRAVAIALVLLSHEWASRNPPEFGIWLPLFSQGSLGVRVFFVLSGFLITQLLVREHVKTGTISLRNFYVRRALRILPVYYLFLLCLASLWSLGLYKDALSSWLGAMTFTRNMLGDGTSATVHFWSLAVEEQFYFLWPATVVFFGLSNRWRTAAAILTTVIVVSFASRLPNCGDHSFLCVRILGGACAVKWADALAVGCLMAILESRGKIKKLSPTANTVLQSLCVLALIVSAIPVTYGSRLADSTALSVQAFLIGGAIYASIFARPTQLTYRVLNCRAAVYLGLVSYSLYVWHTLFISRYIGEALADLPVYDWRIWWVPALLVAMGSFHFYERPIAALRTRFRAPGLPALDQGREIPRVLS